MTVIVLYTKRASWTLKGKKTFYFWAEVQRGIAGTVIPVIFTCLKIVLVPARYWQEIEAQVASWPFSTSGLFLNLSSVCGTSTLRVVWGIWELSVTYLREGGKPRRELALASQNSVHCCLVYKSNAEPTASPRKWRLKRDLKGIRNSWSSRNTVLSWDLNPFSCKMD